MKKELIIAAYDKDLSWVEELNNDIKITIYRKGEILSLKDNKILIKPNLGRCVHTFFNHIYQNYDNLSDITFFVQDYPFDHWGDLIEVINNNLWNKKYTLNFGGYYGFHNNNLGSAWSMSENTQLGHGYIISCYSNGYPQDLNPKINVDSYWDVFFDLPKPNMYEFIPGGHFGLTKEHARLRSKEFYKKIVDMLTSEEVAPWNFERLECYLLNPKFISKF